MSGGALLGSAVDALVLSAIYVLVATGLTMVYGVLRVLHIAHGAVFAVGAFAGLRLFEATGSFWAALLGGMLAGGATGVVMYRAVHRPVLAGPPGVALLASVGVFTVVQDLLQKPFFLGSYPSPFPAAPGLPGFGTGDVKLTPIQVTILLLTVAFTAILCLVLNRSRLGLGWQAAALDAEMAGASGVNLPAAISLNFLLGSALAGAAGVLVGVYYNDVSATMGGVPAYKAFVVIVLGGMGSIGGAAVAAIILAFVETVIAATSGFFLPRDAIAFLVMILVLMFRPYGLFGQE